MAGPVREKPLSLDTNLLLDLADGKDFAHTFREVFLEKGYSLRASPTVIQELTFFALYDRGEKGDLARKALQCMRQWQIKPFDLTSVGHRITERFTETNAKISAGLHCPITTTADPPGFARQNSVFSRSEKT